jgi:hypothetical protein
MPGNSFLNLAANDSYLPRQSLVTGFGGSNIGMPSTENNGPRNMVPLNSNGALASSSIVRTPLS